MNNEYINYFDFEEDSIYENDELQLKIPTFCPHCNQSGKQRLIFAFKTSGTFDNYDGILLALCYDCESTTIHFLKEKQIVFDDWFTSIDSIPKKSMNISVSKYISETFPDFCKNLRTI